MHFLELPVEMLQHIAQFLSVSSIINLGQTCKHLLDVINIDSIWQQLCYRDYKVDSIDGWNLTHKEIYTKVLKKCGFFGWKRLALLPYGGLVYVSWGKGEIQVLRYYPAESTQENLQYDQIYSIQWNSYQDDLEVLCQQCEDGSRPARLSQDGYLYPVIQCASEDCQKSHTRSTDNHGHTNKNFKKGFLDHKDAFQATFSEGYNCPMLPFPSWSAGDEAKCPVQLGLYTGDYGSHGVEILHLSFCTDSPNTLLGLKVTGDPNVPAGYSSLNISLDKPIMLTLADQETVYDMLRADCGREEDSFAELFAASQEGADMRQPFAVPFDCLDRGVDTPNTCIARYLGKGRIAGTYYRHPTFSRCHFIKFSETSFGVIWLDLSSFSIFYRAKGLHMDFHS